MTISYLELSQADIRTSFPWVNTLDTNLETRNAIIQRTFYKCVFNNKVHYLVCALPALMMREISFLVNTLMSYPFSNVSPSLLRISTNNLKTPFILLTEEQMFTLNAQARVQLSISEQYYSPALPYTANDVTEITHPIVSPPESGKKRKEEEQMTELNTQHWYLPYESSNYQASNQFPITVQHYGPVEYLPYESSNYQASNQFPITVQHYGPVEYMPYESSSSQASNQFPITVQQYGPVEYIPYESFSSQASESQTSESQASVQFPMPVWYVPNENNVTTEISNSPNCFTIC